MNKRLGYTIFLGLFVFLLGLFNSGLTEASVDTIPPRFKTIIFSSNIVETGNSIMVYIDSEDQISGIKEATLMLRSSSGMQSEYLWLNQKDSLGRLFGELQVQSDAELGVWEVGYISIEDNAYNYWKYFYQDGLAYEYDNIGNFQQITTTPITIKVVNKSSESLEISKELERIQNQKYETIGSIENAFSILIKYDDLIESLPNNEEKENLTRRLHECTTYLINQCKAITMEKQIEKFNFSQETIIFLVQHSIEEVKAVSLQDKHKIIVFLKPIIKNYANNNMIQQVISEKLNFQ